MSDENQIEIPPSFTALFADRSGTRLRTPISEVRQRYEACEDLALALTEPATFWPMSKCRPKTKCCSASTPACVHPMQV